MQGAFFITYLITGGAGFIGSNFIHYLLQSGKDIRIINVDALTYAGNLDNLSGVGPNVYYRFVKADIRDQDTMRALLAEFQPRVIINFAAESHVDRSIADPGIFIDTNVNGTRVLLDESLRLGVERFIQISTDEVYGSAAPGQYFNEQSPLKPSSPYSASKAAADLLALAYWHTFQLPVVISRCTNNYGPRQYPEKLIPLVIERCLQGNNIPVYGDGLQERDWLYVEDHCAFLARLAEHGRPGQIYNVAGQSQVKNLHLIETIIKQVSNALDDERREKVQPGLIQHVADRKGHDRRYALDDAASRQELGWAPHTSLETGINLTVNWYLNNQLWLQKVRRSENLSR